MFDSLLGSFISNASADAGVVGMIRNELTVKALIQDLLFLEYIQHLLSLDLSATQIKN